MKIIAAILLLIAMYKVYLCSKNWEDVFESEEYIVFGKGVIFFESVVETICSLFILF